MIRKDGRGEFLKVVLTQERIFFLADFVKFLVYGLKNETRALQEIRWVVTNAEFGFIFILSSPVLFSNEWNPVADMKIRHDADATVLVVVLLTEVLPKAELSKSRAEFSKKMEVLCRRKADRFNDLILFQRE